MSVRGQFTVFCNGEHCLVWIGQEDTPAEARRLARQAGWKTSSSKQAGDLCAAHKPDGVPACGRDGARLKEEAISGVACWVCVYCQSAFARKGEFSKGVITP